MVESERDVEDLFVKYDTDNTGSLDSTELTHLLTELMPELSGKELRHLIIQMNEFDLDGDGAISFRELQVGVYVGMLICIE